MTYWNCFVAGCTNNFRTKDTELRYYRVPKMYISHYDAFFKTDCVNWSCTRICSKHWSVPRKNSHHLPDVRLPSETLNKQTKKTPYERADIQYKTTKTREMKTNGILQKNSLIIEDKDQIIVELTRKLTEKINENERIQLRNEELENNLNVFKAELETSERRRKEAEMEIKNLNESLSKYVIFDWQLIHDATFFYLIGMNKDDFNIIFKLVKPYLYLIKYENCLQPYSNQRKLTKLNEFFATLIICRHGVDEGIVAWLTGVSRSTMSRIFVAWITFGSAVFGKLDLSHPKDFVNELMPNIFKKLGFQDVVATYDATEFKTSKPSDLTLNSIFFSHYKNGPTAKAIAGITPHGALCFLSDLYPGSTTDSDLTIFSEALTIVQEKDSILVDKGFCITEHAAEKGATVNRPPMASSEQFEPGEIEDTFNIAACRIHIERWFGRCREYAVLNRIWQTNRMDLLNETWKFIAHLVNLFQVVGPKDSNTE